MMTNCLHLLYLFYTLFYLYQVDYTNFVLCLQENNNTVVREHVNDLKPSNVSIVDNEEKDDLFKSNSSTILNGSTELLLSSEEFVDAKEVPTLLFDGLSNEENKTLTTNISEETVSNIGTVTETTSQKSTNEPPIPITTSDSHLPPTSSINETSLDLNNTTPTSELTNDNSDDNSENGGEEEEDQNENSSGSEEKFVPPQNISQYMDYIEKLFHDLRHQITDLFEPHIPQLIRTSQLVELSSACSYDMLRMALALRSFEPWALRMIDSSGKVPEGIFEGSFTALGSYDECLGTVFESTSSSFTASSMGATTQPTMTTTTTTTTNKDDHHHQQQNDKPNSLAPTQGKYCLVTLSPFMPPKPPADKVERLFQEEANRRNYTKDDQFSRLSPMFYYMKFRIGVCIPSTCDQQDMNSISQAMSSSLRLNITIPDCRVKQAYVPLTRHQFVGALVFGSVLAIVLVATLFDCFKLKWKEIERQERKLIQVASSSNGRKTIYTLNRSHTIASDGNHGSKYDTVDAISININQRHNGNILNKSTSIASNTTNNGQQQQIGCGLQQRAHNQNLHARLRKHGSWMSFSLITNFALYFCHKQQVTTSKNHKAQNDCLIACLNGIRVLSLCWVIVANSYLTLDPRATKRLTKTREAPRDFLFQLVVQASLAIETFFFLSGLLMSISFIKRFKQNHNSSSQQQLQQSTWKWIHFYIHRYVRMTPATMLVIAFSMYAYHFGDGPLWFEATQKVHQSCAQNWWRHLLHVANFIDTRQMCFIHYWYIAADMQLFLIAPILMFLLHKWRKLGFLLIAALGAFSIGSVFYTTYDRNLPPTLLFYSTDPESRREFGNTIMTKPTTHALPYLVGMLVGWFILNQERDVTKNDITLDNGNNIHPTLGSKFPLNGLFGSIATIIALIELFLPYKWNNSHLPTRLMASLYASLFRLFWSLVLAYVVLACRHKRGKRCVNGGRTKSHITIVNSLQSRPSLHIGPSCEFCLCQKNNQILSMNHAETTLQTALSYDDGENATLRSRNMTHATSSSSSSSCHDCFCGSGGNYMNRLLSWSIFNHLSKLSFVAYLIHLPLMSVFIGQTRGLFAFSHTLVIHLAISYLVMTFVLSFVLVHIIEFPFITFERYLFDRFVYKTIDETSDNAKCDDNNANERTKCDVIENNISLTTGANTIVR